MFTDRLNESDRNALTAHLLALSAQDRHVFFGYAARDASVKRYVQDINFNQDRMFGVRGDDRSLDGFVYLGPEKDHADIAVSVLTSARRRGIGTALLSKAATYASRHGVDTLYMEGLRENCAVIRIAQSLGIKVVTDGQDESDAKLGKPRPTAEAQSIGASSITLCDAALRDATGVRIPNRVLQRTWQHLNQTRTVS